MLTFNINGIDYKVKFGYNCFCDSDLLDRVFKMGQVMDGEISGVSSFKEMFSCIRDLLFVGFKKYNPVETVQEIGDLLDTYIDEAPQGEERGLVSIFSSLLNELTNEGFLRGMFATETDNQPMQTSSISNVVHTPIQNVQTMQNQ